MPGFCRVSNFQVVLNNATVETDNPDLRDRAYIYWRLLSTDPEVCFLGIVCYSTSSSTLDNEQQSSVLPTVTSVLLLTIGSQGCCFS